MSKGHPLTLISQLRQCTEDMKASLSRLRSSVNAEFSRELDILWSNIQNLDQSANLLRVRVETRMIETRFEPTQRISRY